MIADEQRIWRWAFRKGYGRAPRGDELDRYRYWHGVSRRISFDASGPWQIWPAKPIPPDAVEPAAAVDAPPAVEPKPAPER